MKTKSSFSQILFFVIAISLFTNLQAQGQTVPGSSLAVNLRPAHTFNFQELPVSSKTTSLTELATTKLTSNHFTGGLGSITQTACESAYTFFYSGGFGTGPIYWDPSLTTKVTWGTLIVDHSTSIIYNFNASTSTIGSPAGNCQWKETIYKVRHSLSGSRALIFL